MKYGHDGLTPYQRIRGTPFRTLLAALGETMRYKMRSHEPILHSSDGQSWHDGIVLGIDRHTGQYIVHGAEGVKHARGWH